MGRRSPPSRCSTLTRTARRSIAPRAALYRIYVVSDAAKHVFDALRVRGDAMLSEWRVPLRPQQMAAPRLTIADLSDFAAETYAELLEAWCKASLAAWSSSHLGL